MSDRWATDLAEEIMKKAGTTGESQEIMLAEVVTVSPFSIKLHDIIRSEIFCSMCREFPTYRISRLTMVMRQSPGNLMSSLPWRRWN